MGRKADLFRQTGKEIALFSEKYGKYLITGKPGVGKTTAIMKLAKWNFSLKDLKKLY